jgi:NAD-dependent deacetylase sirtuin 4
LTANPSRRPNKTLAPPPHISLPTAGLARLQARGWVGPIITQNVDRLHQRAGTRDVLELHGTTHRVICMACGADSCRHDLQQTLAELNPEAAARASAAASAASAAGAAAAYARALRIGTAADARATVGDGSDGDKGPETVPVRRPDGDVELRDAGVSFIVPACPACGADALKPDVVFFGDSIPKERAARAGGLAAGCDALLVIGSSVQVFSAFRLTAAAKEAGARLVLLNVGDTRADGIADVKYPVLAGEALMRLATHPGLLLPRV